MYFLDFLGSLVLCFANKLKALHVTMKAAANGTHRKQLMVKWFLPVVARDSLRLHASDRQRE